MASSNKPNVLGSFIATGLALALKLLASPRDAAAATPAARPAGRFLRPAGADPVARRLAGRRQARRAAAVAFARQRPAASRAGRRRAAAGRGGRNHGAVHRPWPDSRAGLIGGRFPTARAHHAAHVGAMILAKTAAGLGLRRL
ncbi:hypothetical protein M8494_28685 [Serratia ureilytica]